MRTSQVGRFFLKLDDNFRTTRSTRTYIITSVIDNLIKGAGGQAVQNMNIACGLPETLGLF